MRVLIVNTSERTGGAAVAAGRLMDALNNNGIEARMLVRDRDTDRSTVIGLRHKWLTRWNFLWERWRVFVSLHFSKEHLWELDRGAAGNDITQLPAFREADVIHLSWVNQGMLSLKNLRAIIRSGKPVVWTMHDLWPASSICHYARGCKRYASGCGHCPLLPGRGAADDLSARVFRRKRDIYRSGHIHFVSCSRWLEQQARKSGLMEGQSLTNIPNPIDTRVFQPKDKTEVRRIIGLPEDKLILLFVSQKVTDERKGATFFIQAVEKMVAEHPEMRDRAIVVLLGGNSEEVAGQLALSAVSLGYVSDEQRIVNIYAAADAFVMPSLEDNLPNTIMEAMACGVPCVGFRVGGIPEMIDHERNGYVANYRDADDLAAGLAYVLDPERAESLRRACVDKVARCYSQHAVALRYINVYNEALACKRYRL